MFVGGNYSMNGALIIDAISVLFCFTVTLRCSLVLQESIQEHP